MSVALSVFGCGGGKDDPADPPPAAQSYSVGGMVSGVAPGKPLVLANNGGDDLSVGSDGAFTFPTELATGTAYTVTFTAPAGQTCTLTHGDGTVNAADVTDVAVACVTPPALTYSVGGRVSGLGSGKSVVLKNNSGNALTVTTSGDFTFTNKLLNGAAYGVSVATDPAGQHCTLAHASGSINAANVNTVAVTCTDSVVPTYSVGGTVSGLAPTKTLVLRNNSGDDLTIDADGPFTFPAKLANAALYAVTVTAPAGQSCTVAHGGGTINAANVTDVAVNCTITAPPTYSVGGTVAGLAPGKALVLQNNGGDSLNINGNVPFTFPAKLLSGTNYSVSVTAPAGQNCAVANSGGTIGSANITNVSVTCVNTYSVGGSVSGLGTGKFVVLTNNAGDSLTVSASGPFTFSTKLLNGAPYLVAVATSGQPAGQTCTVASGSGNINAANVSTVNVTCINTSTPTYSVGGSLSGLGTGKSVVLTHNGTSLNMSADGPFTFTNKLPNGATYTVTTTQPSGQTCTVASGGGTISAADVTNVAISCVVNSAGPVYYVAPSGDDSRSTTQARNASTPWRTITKAANTLVAGDTVQVRAGTYAEKVAPAHSGSATAGHITFMAYPGETVVMDATGIFSSAVPAWDGAFNISDKSYIKIIGFQIPVSDGFGVFIQNSNHIEVRKNIISHTQFSGVFAKESSYITVDGNDIGFANISMNQESISMVSVTQFSIGNNIVHDGHKEGIDAKNASAYGKIFNNEVYGIARIGIYIEGFGSDQTDIDVYGNIVRDGNPAASGAGEDGIRVGNEYGARESNIRIFNNIVYNARKNGISVSGWTHDHSISVFTNISIYNNTTYGNGFNGDGGSGIRIDAADNFIGLVVRNNIAVGNKSVGITGIPSGQTQSNNFVSGDPKFVDVANHTFHLKAGSPVIDAGFTILGLTTDFSGAARPHGAGFDIGALEYRGDL